MITRDFRGSGGILYTGPKLIGLNISDQNSIKNLDGNINTEIYVHIYICILTIYCIRSLCLYERVLKSSHSNQEGDDLKTQNLNVILCI